MGYVARMDGFRKAGKSFIRSEMRTECDNIKMDLKEMECGIVG